MEPSDVSNSWYAEKFQIYVTVTATSLKHHSFSCAITIFKQLMPFRWLYRQKLAEAISGKSSGHKTALLGPIP